MYGRHPPLYPGRPRRQPSPEAEQQGEVRGRPFEDSRVKELEQALEQARDSEIQLVREFRNYRRHAEADLARSADRARSQLLAELGDTVQALERAGDAAGSDPESVREGIALVAHGLMQVFDRHGVSRIRTRGATFDPTIHEAVLAEKVPGILKGTVIRELSPGFRTEDEVIHPAKVSVAA